MRRLVKAFLININAAVGANKALVKEFTATASTTGAITITITYIGVRGCAKSSAVEILSAPAATSVFTINRPESSVF